MIGAIQRNVSLPNPLIIALQFHRVEASHQIFERKPAFRIERLLQTVRLAIDQRNQIFLIERNATNHSAHNARILRNCRLVDLGMHKFDQRDALLIDMNARFDLHALTIFIRQTINR